MFRNLEALFFSLSHQKHAKKRRYGLAKPNDRLRVSGVEIARKINGE